jgi:hypothetical protein
MPTEMPIAHKISEDIEVNLLTRLYWKFFGFEGIWKFLPYSVKSFYYDHVRTIFAPHHSRIRKAVPRQWNDLTEIIVAVNFEIIKSFYEDEMLGGFVDWDASTPHRKFKKWIEGAYQYITEERPKLQKDLDTAYPDLDDTLIYRKIGYDQNGLRVTKIENTDKTYEELYGEVDRIEQLIDKKDSQYIIEMIKFRKYFWT